MEFQLISAKSIQNDSDFEIKHYQYSKAHEGNNSVTIALASITRCKKQNMLAIDYIKITDIQAPHWLSNETPDRNKSTIYTSKDIDQLQELIAAILKDGE